MCDCRHVKEHATNSGKATHNHQHYSKEKHSLQGKHGKTHAVC
jgi:glutamate decarboxylase